MICSCFYLGVRQRTKWLSRTNLISQFPMNPYAPKINAHINAYVQKLIAELSIRSTSDKTPARLVWRKGHALKIAEGINKAIFCQVSDWHQGYLLWGCEGGIGCGNMLADILPCLPNLSLSTWIILNSFCNVPEQSGGDSEWKLCGWI